MKAAALVQLYGGDGMALLESHDVSETLASVALARTVAEMDLERMKTQARLTRNEIAEMLNERG